MAAEARSLTDASLEFRGFPTLVAAPLRVGAGMSPSSVTVTDPGDACLPGVPAVSRRGMAAIIVLVLVSGVVVLASRRKTAW